MKNLIQKIIFIICLCCGGSFSFAEAEKSDRAALQEKARRIQSQEKSHKPWVFYQQVNEIENLKRKVEILEKKNRDLELLWLSCQ